MNAMKLFNSKENCCGCSACMNVCPKDAITMELDADGNTYPVINSDLCVCCGMCQKVCNFQSSAGRNPVLNAFAAVSKDIKIMMKSSSGGVFSALANAFIINGGIVYGCSLVREGTMLLPKHIRIDEINDISKLQGSKYVQSQIQMSYRQVKADLLADKTVLFSGTPCQIDGLYGFLKGVQYDNLFTVEIICHGVPGIGVFQNYLRHIENKEKGIVVDINFRDKAYGWGAKGSYSVSKNGKVIKRMISPHNSAYYRLFLDSMLYRENCYSCKYASKTRVADITIGDFWGVEVEHPEAVIKWKKEHGISCFLVNTAKGEKLKERYATNIEFIDSSFEKVSRKNPMLLRPCKNNSNRSSVRKLFSTGGYSAVEKWCWKKQGLKRIAFLIADKLR